MNAADPHMQAEQLRHQYLQALGISSWLPREPLAGARASDDWVWQFQQGAAGAQDVEAGGDYDGDYAEGDSAEQAAVAPRPARRDRVPAGAGRAALLDSLDATPAATAAAVPAAPTAPAPAPVVPAVAPVSPVAAVAAPAPAQASEAASARPRRTEPQVIPEFKLAFLALGDGLIIDSLPPQSRGGFSSAHLRLAMALWRALGMPAVESPRAQLLPWPAFTSRSLDQGWDQAQTAVQRKFDLMLAQAPVRFVLLLGDSAARLLLQSPEGGDGMRGMLFRPRSQVAALATASLSEMLQVPGCKRDVWRELQPLIQYLSQATPADG
ncbi:hypothetical protein [Marinobacterium rhizophilum]|uniref:DNA polymerase n=1 Tax=Marinobacterium rhizophilum TaxID=420402 RepID=A0ABY5HG85_9GAMM|nr:hypothetical protein [Marinobacterium rhizophilum]UTW10322.1 hypothetical protein KDW95_13530 [Marinobacterium rhizophilum]